jgi:hypothetical protein
MNELAHRKVWMEHHLCVIPVEHVIHHRDGNNGKDGRPLNNDPSNLRLMPDLHHRRYHFNTGEHKAQLSSVAYLGGKAVGKTRGATNVTSGQIAQAHEARNSYHSFRREYVSSGKGTYSDASAAWRHRNN